MNHICASAAISSVSAGEAPGEVVIEFETREGSERIRSSFRLRRSSADLLADALPLVRDGRVGRIEATDLGNEGDAA